MLFKFVLESNAPSNLIRTPILKAIFGWKRCALYSRKYGIYIYIYIYDNINIFSIHNKFVLGGGRNHHFDFWVSKFERSGHELDAAVEEADLCM